MLIQSYVIYAHDDVPNAFCICYTVFFCYLFISSKKIKLNLIEKYENNKIKVENMNIFI